MPPLATPEQRQPGSRAPVLVLAGAHDPLFPARLVLPRARAAVPDARWMPWSSPGAHLPGPDDVRAARRAPGARSSSTARHDGDRYRGRTTRQRNVAEKVAREWAERRAAAEAHASSEVDLERASAEAEVELLDPAATADAGGDGGAATATTPRRAAAARSADRAGSRPVAPGAASRTSRSLPRLLHDTGSFGSLRERLGPVAAAARACTAGTSG